MREVFGARGNLRDVAGFLARVQEAAARHHVVIQVMDASLVYGRLHLLSAYDHAVRSFAEGTNATGSVGLETLLYASGESQIQKALGKMGVKPGTTAFAIVVGTEGKGSKNFDAVFSDFSSATGLSRDDAVLEGDRETLQRFGISDQEIATVAPSLYGDLVLERVAMVDVLKR